MDANAFVTLTNPIANTLEINGRLGANDDVLLGASTEAPDGSYDLFVAMRPTPVSKRSCDVPVREETTPGRTVEAPERDYLAVQASRFTVGNPLTPRPPTP